MTEVEELLDYAEDNQHMTEEQPNRDNTHRDYTDIHSASFKDFQLREELQTVIKMHGFEHPSEVQYQCIPQALNGRDVICQAKSGMGKTAVFVLSILHMLKPDKSQCQTVVLTHTRELAVQIYNEFKRFAKELPLTIDYYLGGEPLNLQAKKTQSESSQHCRGCSRTNSAVSGCWLSETWQS